MKQSSLTAILAAGVLCFAVQAGASEVTNDWFSVDFTSALDAKWTQATADASAIVTSDIPTGRLNDSAPALKLETNGEELLYTPETYSGDSDKTVLEMQVYLVGSDEPPTVSDGAQTAVYLDTADGSVLKAYVDGAWVSLASDVEAGWHDVTIIMDYTDTQKAFFELDGDPVGSSDGYATGSSATAVASLGFKGSGYVDNFVGKAVAAGSEPLPPFYDNTGSEDAESTVAYADSVNKTVAFNATKANGSGGFDTLKFIRVYDANGNFKTLRYTTVGGAAVNYEGASKVVAYYGDSVSNVDAATDAPKAVVSLDGGAATVTVDDVKSGLYYALYDVTGTDPVLVDSFLVGINGDGDDVAFDETVSASASDWGVVKFVVKASDEDPVSK